ncbi:MAG TPA: tripartite tricarboxylate transporter substrate binding protein [Alphaproteobacteria bacterium]|nr:tripartite tricarboxylate transporter substrate binding protein [Alphaproteobacteria bacterium]
MLRRLTGSLLAAALVVAASAANAADTYPTKPIRLVLPFGAGGAADVTARLVAQKLSNTLGQQVIVDNKPSAGGIVAAQVVLSQPSDGYDLLFVTSGTAISAGLFKQLPFDPLKDLEPISLVGAFPILILVDKSSPMTSLKGLMDAMKAKPGTVNAGAVNIGSTQDLNAELFKSLSGLDFQIIPFKTTPDLVGALSGHQIDVAFEIVTPVLGMVKGGQLRALAVSSAARFSGLPSVPPVKESGVPGFDVSAWNSIAAKAGTPKPIIDRLNQDIQKALAQPDLREKFAELGIDPRGGTPAEAKQLLMSEVPRWAKVIKDAHIPLK